MSVSTYVTDPNHTFVHFGVRHFGASTVHARFDDVAGKVTLDHAGRAATADITVQMTSVDSGIPYFNAHLCSPEFFDVIKFPTARFVSKHATFNGDTPASVEGELTLMGQTHPVTLTCTNSAVYDNPLHQAEVCGGDFTATLKRSQWGINWGLEMGVPDDVVLEIQIEAIKQ
ncbi:MAG: polyisoprenoid-binding protein [Rhodanobacteraceae bacterium]|nr:MAG: polyisoprenoid-binding protein [Rhodanobacteraceae bacterium]